MRVLILIPLILLGACSDERITHIGNGDLCFEGFRYHYLDGRGTIPVFNKETGLPARCFLLKDKELVNAGR